jgi:hypothetical protein
MQDAGRQWADIAGRYHLKEPGIDRLVSWWHTDADLGRPLEVRILPSAQVFCTGTQKPTPKPQVLDEKRHACLRQSKRQQLHHLSFNAATTYRTGQLRPTLDSAVTATIRSRRSNART